MRSIFLLQFYLATCSLSAQADVDPYEPVPAMATSGKAQWFDSVMTKIDPESPEGMTAVEQSNPLQFSALTDFWCAWELTDYKRKPALLIDDVQVEYYQYVKGVLPQVKLLVDAFRKAGLPIFWSTWYRFSPDDGYFNTMDRFYGPIGSNSSRQALYNHDQVHGADVIAEVAPINDEERRRVMHKSYSLDMFDERPMEWLVPSGQKTLHSELQDLGVNTVVQVGAWTDDCIIATAYHAFGLQYDVVLVEDGVSTASKQHFNAIEVMRGSIAKIVVASQVADYINNGLPVLPPALRKTKTVGARIRDEVKPDTKENVAISTQAKGAPISAAVLTDGQHGVVINAIRRPIQMLDSFFLAFFGVFAGCFGFAAGWLVRGLQAGRNLSFNNLLG